VKRDHISRGRFLGGTPPFGFKVGHGAREPVPELIVAVARMRQLRARGLSLRAVADRMKIRGIVISHVGVKKALAAADRRRAA
jgi:putative DNA-invertase from lambdoid prophage Rac